MGRMVRVATMAFVIWAAGGVRAEGPDVKLEPGVPAEFMVAGTPPSLADLYRATRATSVRMAIRLPKSYKAGKSYPVLVFLSGGDGGTGGEFHQAEPFLGGEDFILCNLPIFKRDLQGKDDDERLSITARDADHAVPAFRVLLNELRRRVPNIDEERSVLAGFSNGANSIALLLWDGDKDLLARFSTYVMIEGGFWLASGRGDSPRRAPLADLAGKRVLLLFGDQTRPADRIPFIEDARRTARALRAAGVDAATMAMTDVGHDFPPAEMARARRWVLSGPPHRAGNPAP